MITPRFSCTQTTDSVIISIYCPAIRAADVEIAVDESLVTVHVNPYFLRVNFPHPLVEDDTSSAKYDPRSGYLTVVLAKENRGQEFADLDLLAKLLAPRPSATEGPSIEVLSSETIPSTDKSLADGLESLSLEQDEFTRAAKNDWQLPQTVPDETETALQKHYGFLDLHSGYFKHVASSENEVNELGPDAETCPPAERRSRRIEHEDKKWDEEYYLADYADPQHINELLEWQTPYLGDYTEIQYTEDEQLMMLRLPRREYLPTATQTHDLYLTLITLLFSYAYDARTTLHEPTAESAWTICNLTPAFTALEPPKSSFSRNCQDYLNFTADELSEALVASYRRSLAFPLYRSFALSEACRVDVANILKRGKRTVVRCLLEMKNILDHHEVYYVYSKIWADDFTVWTQSASDNVLTELGTLLHDLRMQKNAIGWGLDELEAALGQLSDRESDSDDESTVEPEGPVSFR